MTDRVFGAEPEHETARPRRAAYVVVRIGGSLAVVKHRSLYFLPGGESASKESPAETVVREVGEELFCEISVDREIGTAVQYFYSSDDRVHYRMEATFFTGNFTTEPRGQICWLSDDDLKDLFHECHGWAVDRASRGPSSLPARTTS